MKSVEVDVRPREGSRAVCSGCHQPAPGYESRSAPLVWMKSVRQRPPIPDAGRSDRPRAHPLAVGRQGTHGGIFPRFLYHHWRSARCADRVCLLGHVAALPGRDPPECSQALHILDRFHIVAKMNKALDDVRAAESPKMARDGYPALLVGLSRARLIAPTSNRSCCEQS
jgi:hypothetical protein